MAARVMGSLPSKHPGKGPTFTLELPMALPIIVAKRTQKVAVAAWDEANFDEPLPRNPGQAVLEELVLLQGNIEHINTSSS